MSPLICTPPLSASNWTLIAWPRLYWALLCLATSLQPCSTRAFQVSTVVTGSPTGLPTVPTLISKVTTLPICNTTKRPSKRQSRHRSNLIVMVLIKSSRLTTAHTPTNSPQWWIWRLPWWPATTPNTCMRLCCRGQPMFNYLWRPCHSHLCISWHWEVRHKMLMATLRMLVLLFVSCPVQSYPLLCLKELKTWDICKLFQECSYQPTGSQTWLLTWSSCTFQLCLSFWYRWLSTQTTLTLGCFSCYCHQPWCPSPTAQVSFSNRILRPKSVLSSSTTWWTAWWVLWWVCYNSSHKHSLLVEFWDGPCVFSLLTVSLMVFCGPHPRQSLFRLDSKTLSCTSCHQTIGICRIWVEMLSF